MGEKKAYSFAQICIRRMRFFGGRIKGERSLYVYKFLNQIKFEIEHFESFFDSDLDFSKYSKVLPRVVVSVGNYCTLRCKECSQLIPYAREHYYEEKEVLAQNINNFLSDIDMCVCVDIVGGEPLLYSDLTFILDILISSDKVAMIEITTNGTIFPSDELLNFVSNKGQSKVLFKFSDYGRIAKRDEIIAVLEENKIKYEKISMPIWYGFGNSDVKNNNRSEKELSYQYYMCMDNVACKMIAKGKIYTCGRASGLEDYGLLTKKNDDWLDLNKPLDYTTIRNFYCDKRYSSICNFCGDYSTDNMKIVSVAEQLE
ncbi:radical SAM protein [Butyrivibrio sp. XBB1001]|uniref:radical SAM protein n=1 Tax=Butyrivibrio sp. XBB1001 TaxID=1280682 RepID=UPI000415DC0D|nr:radical SAM protein [Butyrivibrio sp. XBB1001]